MPIVIESVLARSYTSWIASFIKKI
jgi:hypothetical protein